MSRVQVKSNAFSQQNQQRAKLASAARAGAQKLLKDLNTTGLTSAQIDAAVFGSSSSVQAADGLQIIDSTNKLFLVRVAGQWGKLSLTLIS